jgi:hypothetical protein
VTGLDVGERGRNLRQRVSVNHWHERPGPDHSREPSTSEASRSEAASANEASNTRAAASALEAVGRAGDCAAGRRGHAARK